MLIWFEAVSRIRLSGSKSCSESQDLKLAWDLGNPLQRQDLTVGFVLKAVDCWVLGGLNQLNPNED